MTIYEKDTIKVRKCIGIPMYPEEYHFDMERPKGITTEQINARKNKVDKFLEKKDLLFLKIIEKIPFLRYIYKYIKQIFDYCYFFNSSKILFLG